MRAPINPTGRTQRPCTINTNINATISPTSSLYITITTTTYESLTISISSRVPTIPHNGMTSISPSYCSTGHLPEFIPFRPHFLLPRTLQCKEEKTGKAYRHAALMAHLNAELREDGGPWENVERESKTGRGGYNVPVPN
ncbi:hypothetical protein EKO04_000992 [Ascochyta lentis]|uniref:Uncharacterized protein n=1 Tax=Ascochyta lentis TaxID=205686 RepID=A0A8H7MMH6_9PLEO|nr:hypothetical protein EKO04_000992 [Ascochyta lentis]